MPVSDTISVNRGYCILPVGASPSDSVAVRCAELFVGRNGYTDLPAVSDSARWVGESMDPGMASRQNTLEPRAYALCGSTQPDSFTLVVFRRPVPGSASGNTAVIRSARAVRIHPDLSMGIVHQDFRLDAGLPTGCRALR
jgi:hypothetical protein